MTAPASTESGETSSQARSQSVAFITQFYSPEPVLNPEWTAHALQASGLTPLVLTGVPNYPDGKLRPGYRLRNRRERIDGVRVHRVPLIPNHGRRALGRMLNYCSWALSASTLGLPTLRSADVVLVYMTPATAALPALVARLLFRRQYILVVQDLWPDSIFAAGFLAGGTVRRIVEALLHRFVNAAYRHAQHVVAISPGMREILHDRGVPEQKTSVIYNWTDEDLFKPTPADPHFRTSLGLNKDDFVVLYAGNHGPAQGLSTLIEAIASLPMDMRCHAVLIGGGIDKPQLQQLAERIAPDRIHFLSALPPDELPAIMAACDLQLISLIDQPLFRVTMPGKVQAAMAAGRPLIVSASGDVPSLVSSAKAGLVADAGDVGELAAQIAAARSLTPGQLREMGTKAREAYLSTMSASAAGRALRTLLQAAIQATQR